MASSVIMLSDNGVLTRFCSRSDNVSDSNLVPSVNLIDARIEIVSSVVILSDNP